MKIERIVSIVAIGGVLTGCATKEMKSTPFYEGGEVEYIGEVSDRVNLWPVAYWRNPVGAVAWPLVSFSDDHFAFRPIYSQYRQTGKDGAWDEFNFVWPIAQADTKHDDYRIFPVFWGKDYAGRDYQAVFPVYWNGAHYNSLFPIWYYGSTTNSWHFNAFAGLAGARRTKNDYRASWAFPLWYEDNTGLFTTLLYGQTKNSHWVFPLWYKGERAFISPIYAQGEDDDKFWWTAPAFLSWGEKRQLKNYCRSEGSVLLGLAGWEAYNDRMKSIYAFPLFSWRNNGSWLTPLGGQVNCNGTTNTVITALVGVTSGKKTGGWVFPIWSHEKDADFAEKVALIDSPTLPDCVKVSVVTNMFKDCDDYGKTRLTGTGIYSRDNNEILLHDDRQSISGWNSDWRYGALTNDYKIAEHHKRGHKLLFNYESDRKVTFDLKTRAKLSDTEESEASLLLWLFDYEWKHDRTSGDEHTRHRVLWRLWHWEEANGDVSLDVFPSFTYDSRKDGYTKTSLLWRLFRYESNPNAGTSVDFLFLPIWR